MDTRLTFLGLQLPKLNVEGSNPFGRSTEFTLEFTRPHKYEWLLSATFRYSHDETSDEFTLRCDAVGRGLLRKIANALRTPCILLRNMQTVLEEFP